MANVNIVIGFFLLSQDRVSLTILKPKSDYVCICNDIIVICTSKRYDTYLDNSFLYKQFLFL